MGGSGRGCRRTAGPHRQDPCPAGLRPLVHPHSEEGSPWGPGGAGDSAGVVRPQVSASAGVCLPAQACAHVCMPYPHACARLCTHTCERVSLHMYVSLLSLPCSSSHRWRVPRLGLTREHRDSDGVGGPPGSLSRHRSPGTRQPRGPSAPSAEVAGMGFNDIPVTSFPHVWASLWVHCRNLKLLLVVLKLDSCFHSPVSSNAGWFPSALPLCLSHQCDICRWHHWDLGTMRGALRSGYSPIGPGGQPVSCQPSGATGTSRASCLRAQVPCNTQRCVCERSTWRVQDARPRVPVPTAST